MVDHGSRRGPPAPQVGRRSAMAGAGQPGRAGAAVRGGAPGRIMIRPVSMPDPAPDPAPPSTAPAAGPEVVIRAVDLAKTFRLGFFRRRVEAVRSITFDGRRGGV